MIRTTFYSILPLRRPRQRHLHRIEHIFNALLHLGKILPQKRKRFTLFSQGFHHLLSQAFDQLIIPNDLADILNYNILEPFFPHAFLLTTQVFLHADALVIAVGLSGTAGTAFANHHALTAAAE